MSVAATGLTTLMIGAAITHGRRKEFQMITINVVLMAAAPRSPGAASARTPSSVCPVARPLRHGGDPPSRASSIAIPCQLHAVTRRSRVAVPNLRGQNT
ncbi:DoxX family protein [Streptomyces mirabilis]|uniref:DoxX family protein n=1 Tax=Streptomyces mirabilis TaxID=68239 RepID=UPI00339038DA